MNIPEAFLTAWVITLRVVIPGWIYVAGKGETPGGRAVKILQIGLCANLLPLLLLGPFSLWTPLLDWTAWTLISAAGFRKSHLSQGKALVVPGLFLLLSTLLILLLPTRSEWLAGGWDPGIYQNNAVAISRGHGIEGKSQTVFTLLTQEELHSFSTTEGAYREVFPGVPVEESTHRIPLYFFHLTPMLGAWIYRLAGIEGLLRLPMLLGVWMIPLLWKLFAIWDFKRLAWLGTLFWCLSPLWIYQLAIPTAEVLYLFFLLSALIALSQRPQAGFFGKGWIGLLMFLATVNHFNFPMVGGLILFAFVWMKPAEEKGGMILPAFAGLWAGVLWDVCFAGVTLSRLEEKDQAVTLVVAGLLFFTVLSGVFSRLKLPPKLRQPLDHLVNVLFVGMGCGMVLSAVLFFCKRFDTGLLHRWQTFSAFWGPGAMVVAGLGLLLLGMRSEEKVSWTFRAALLGLLLLFGLFMIHPGIAPIYPWALRRYIAVALPLLTAASLFAFRRLWTTSKAPLAVLPVLLLALLMLSVLPLSRAAARLGDYRGIHALLEELRTHLQPGDVVVADDPRWGTPLFLSYEIDVLNGKHLWENKDPQSRANMIQSLARLEQEEKKRILWLTSTSSALDHYPDRLPVSQIFMEKRFLTYPVVIHSPKATHFALKTLHKPFGLYELDLSSFPANDDSL